MFHVPACAALRPARCTEPDAFQHATHADTLTVTSDGHSTAALLTNCAACYHTAHQQRTTAKVLQHAEAELKHSLPWEALWPIEQEDSRKRLL